MRIYHVYVDWTTEDEPRPYYVGKGLTSRISLQIRNKHHTNVSNKYGFRREIIFSSYDDNACKQLEIQKIKEFHTFVQDPDYNQIGCNYTTGGDGGRFPGWHHSEETKQIIREKRALQIFTPEMRNRISKQFKGKKLKQEHAEKLRQHLTKLNQTSNVIKNVKRGKLFAVEPQTILNLRKSGMTLQAIADMFSVSKQAIRYFIIRHS